MNKLLLLVFLTIGITKLNAQYTLDKDTFEITYNSGLSEFSEELLFTNTSGSTLATTWSFIDFSMVPTTWSFGFCDNVSCYPITTTTNLSNTFSLAKDSSFHLSVHISPFGTSANILVPVNFNALGYRKNVYLKININATGTNDLQANNISIYPNPTSNFIIIENKDKNINEVSITDINGKIVYTSSVSQKEEINSSDFSAGTYIVNLLKDGVFVANKKIQITH